MLTIDEINSLPLSTLLQNNFSCCLFCTSTTFTILLSNLSPRHITGNTQFHLFLRCYLCNNIIFMSEKHNFIHAFSIAKTLSI